MEILETIGKFILNIINIISDTTSQVISFIGHLSSFIFEYISFLPKDILTIFSTAIVLIIAVFIYRFVR